VYLFANSCPAFAIPAAITPLSNCSESASLSNAFLSTGCSSSKLAVKASAFIVVGSNKLPSSGAN